MKPSDWPLSTDEEQTKISIESVGEYLLVLHTRRVDGGMLVRLLDGPRYLCQILRNDSKETIDAVMI
jgi:hypothetical protein